MPNPKKGESKSDFISRFMSSEEAKRDYPDEKQRSAVAYSKFKTKKARTVDGFESPEPGNIPEKEKQILARVYAEQRKKGMSKEKASKIAWGAVHNYRNSNKSVDESYDEIQKALADIDKAEEGDKRMIFGKPATYTSGKRVTDEGDASGGESSAGDFEDDEDIDWDSEEEPGTEPPGLDPEDMLQDLIDSGISPEQWAEDPSNPTEEEINDAVDYFLNEDEVELDDEACGGDKVKKLYKSVQKSLAGVHDPAIRNGGTTTEDEHSHSYQIDVDGNGTTTGMIGIHGVPHIHEIKNFKIKSAQNHTHFLSESEDD